MAAHKQGKFFPYHDLLFEKMKEIKKGKPTFIAFARQLKLDMAKFRADYASDEIRQQVEKDMAEGSKVGVGGTPTFYVNGKKAGATLKALQKEINKELIRLGFKEKDLPKGPRITTKGSFVKGAKDAPVLMAEFSDFQ